MKFNFYGTPRMILKLREPFTAIPIIIDEDAVEADENGKKIVPAGSIMGGKDGKIMLDPSVRAVVSNDANAEGVLFQEVEVTNGPATGTMVVEGFIDIDKLPEEPAEDVNIPQVEFMR